MPKFSIIIPVYNVASYLRDCLDSVLAQACADWEAVCVNDGSTDQSLSILKEYTAKDKRIRIIDQPNGGLSAARNVGLKAAKGEYVFFLDGDDWIVPDALEKLNQQIAGQDMIVYSGRQHATYASGMEYYNANALLPHKIPFVCAVLRIYKRTFLQAYNLWFTKGIYHEDNLFTPIACYYAGKVTVIPDELYVYRIRENSIMTTFNAKRLTDMTYVANTLAAFFINAVNIDKAIVYRAITHHYQVVLLHSANIVRQYVLPTMDWHLYYTVSRTKLRHRLNYLKNRLKYLFVH